LSNLVCGIIEFDVDSLTNVIENGMASKWLCRYRLQY